MIAACSACAVQHMHTSPGLKFIRLLQKIGPGPKSGGSTYQLGHKVLQEWAVEIKLYQSFNNQAVLAQGMFMEGLMMDVLDITDSCITVDPQPVSSPFYEAPQLYQ